MPMRAYAIRTPIDDYAEPTIVYAETAGKAKYQLLRGCWDAGWEISFHHLKCRSLGLRETPAEQARSKIDAFNQRYPAGTPVRVYPGAMGDHERAYDTTIAAPGAYLSGCRRTPIPVVKVPGDSIALTHVVPLVPLPAAAKVDAAH